MGTTRALAQSPVGWMSDTDWQQIRNVGEAAIISASVDADTLHVREQGGNNRGPMVRQYLGSVGLNEGYAWCAAFVTYHCQRAGIPAVAFARHPAMAKSWLTHAGLTPTSNIKEVSRGDLGGWFNPQTGKGHIFFITDIKKIGPLYYVKTIEGNTSSGALGSQRDGDGVYRRTRLVTKDFRFARLSRIPRDLSAVVKP